MREPPELREPFSSEDERASYIIWLLELDRHLEELRSAAALPGSALRGSPVWPQISEVASHSGDSVEGRLRRWANLFADDLDAIHQARNRVVHNTWLSDYDLRAAVWLAGQVLGLIIGGAAGRLTAS
jgi:hypothetical protein